MNKENSLYGIIGLLVGLIIGYVGTNYINRTSSPPPSSEAATANSGELPADHPPTGDGNADASGGQQGEVMAVIQQAQNEPSNFEAQMQAASLYRQISRHEKALEFYERALKIKPNDLDLLIKLGDTNFDLERFPEAERLYQSALKIKPNNPTVRMDLGLTYYLRQPRQIDQAIAEYRKALTYDPQHEKVLQNLTSALIEKGDKEGARGTLKQLERANPNNQALKQFQDRLKE